MNSTSGLLPALIAITLSLHSWAGTQADTGESTRVTNDRQHACATDGSKAYREKSAYVLKELDLEPGDVVVDIGAGDGWWAEKMAQAVGPQGAVHAGEVVQGKVDKMKQQYADLPQLQPYLCPTDGTALEENSCDLAFVSKTYHHLNKDGHVDYLRHLQSVVKPTGRLVVVERYRELGVGRSKDHAWSPGLLTQQAEEAGWILVRCELIGGSYHFIAIFAQKELFPVKPPAKKPDAAAANTKPSDPNKP
jgi:predicted methyltransferase